MRTAIVHDWLDTWGGAETVLTTLLELYPDADLYAVVDFLHADDRRRLGSRPIRVSFIQKLPFARRHFRKYLPLMPAAIERFDLSRYELVISSSHAVAKGVRTSPGQLHVCLCYSPARYAWNLQLEYLARAGLDRGLRGWAAGRMLHWFRGWDLRAAARVDRYVAISEYIARRIKSCYRRSATVIYPPVNVVRQRRPPAPRAPFYVTVSRLVPYKRVDLLVEAFARMPERELVVVGDGPEMQQLAASAPPNVRLAGRLPDDERDRLLSMARAFVFAAEEDFGIAPLEAQACGTPVIAFARGGAAETIRGLETAEPTGVLFDEQSAASICAAIATFERHGDRISADTCRANAQRFAPDVFRRRFADFVATALAEFHGKHQPGPSSC